MHFGEASESKHRDKDENKIGGYLLVDVERKHNGDKPVAAKCGQRQH